MLTALWWGLALGILLILGHFIYVYSIAASIASRSDYAPYSSDDSICVATHYALHTVPQSNLRSGQSTLPARLRVTPVQTTTSPSE